MIRFLSIAFSIACFIWLHPCKADGQSFYFTGSFVDSASRSIPFVQIKLYRSPLVFEAGSSGEFGIPSFYRTDSAICYAPGFDTLRVYLTSGKFEKMILPFTNDILEKAKQESRLTNLTTQTMHIEKSTTYAGGGESYNEIVENAFVTTVSSPSTAFVPNNNHASYSNIRRFINQGSKVPANAVRIEEMWNYFSPPLAAMQANHHSFQTAIQLAVCPWQPNNWLLMLYAMAPIIETSKLPPANMVFLIDNSGSMEDHNRLPLLKIGFKKMVEHLRPIDRVSIVTYGGAPGIMLPPTSGAAKDTINAAIDALIAGGSTQGSNGIHLAYQLATTNAIDSGINKVILATDGDFNVGIIENDALESMISAYRSSGVTLTCLGVGMGNYKDSKIEVLAKMGNGNFAYLDSEEEAQKVLVEEFTENLYNIAVDATIRIEFDPLWVREYKLLGYDNRMEALTSGKQVLMGTSIGSGQSVVAMFEIVPDKSFPYQMIDLGLWQLKYKHANEDSSYVMLNRRLEIEAQSLPATDSAFKQAAALAWYALQLRIDASDQLVSFEQPLQLAQMSFSEGNKAGAGFISLIRKTHSIYYPQKEQKKKKKLFKKE